LYSFFWKKEKEKTKFKNEAWVGKQAVSFSFLFLKYGRFDLVCIVKG
jgi:hypothetical protein